MTEMRCDYDAVRPVSGLEQRAMNSKWVSKKKNKQSEGGPEPASCLSKVSMATDLVEARGCWKKERGEMGKWKIEGRKHESS